MTKHDEFEQLWQWLKERCQSHIGTIKEGVRNTDPRDSPWSPEVRAWYAQINGHCCWGVPLGGTASWEGE